MATSTVTRTSQNTWTDGISTVGETLRMLGNSISGFINTLNVTRIRSVNTGAERRLSVGEKARAEADMSIIRHG